MQIDPQEIEDTNLKIRSGEYFRESSQMYDFAVHDPMVERYLYILITFLAILVVFISFGAAQSLYPLSTRVPFVFDNDSIERDLPKIMPLRISEQETANDALRRFLIGNYVQLREQYDITEIERNASGVRSQSTPQVFEDYQRRMDPRNGESPITRYQRDLTRQVNIVSLRGVGAGAVEVVFDATLTSKTERKTSRWVATVAFEYEDVKVDDNAVITPFQFKVTQYSSRPV